MIDEPKHERLRRALLDDIAAAAPHSPLPTERTLAARHNVSRATVRQALDALAGSGAVYRVQGAGTFVAGPTISKTLSLTSFTQDMTERGLRPDSRLLAADEIAAGEDLADGLGIDAGDPVVRLTRVRLGDGVPICLESVHLPGVRVPDLLRQDLSGSLYELLARRYRLRIVRADQVLRAVLVESTEAALLGVVSGTAALQIRRIGLDDRDRPLEYTTSLYRADRYDLRFSIRSEA